MSQDVYDEIRRLISVGHYIGGDALPEVELAERLGVSRTPIREALRRLQAEGIVERRSNRRVYLADMDPTGVVEIFTVRAALEPIAARLATPCVQDDFLEYLAALIERMEEVRLQTPPNLRAYRQANEEFHWAILARAGNAALETTVRTVARQPLVSPTFNGWNWEELERSQHHHRELIAAFKARDADWAEAVMRCHMLAARAAFIRVSQFGGALCGNSSDRCDEDALTGPQRVPRRIDVLAKHL